MFPTFYVVVLYAVTASYFAGVMVRLMLTLTPVVCILASIGFSVTLDNYIHNDGIPIEEEQDENVPEKKEILEEKKKVVRCAWYLLDLCVVLCFHYIHVV